MTARRRLFISLAILLTIYWVGVVGYCLLDRRLSLLDSIYMVTITLGTVGYQDEAFQHPAIRVWTILLIVFGCFSVAIVIASLAGWLVESDIGRALGSRKVEARIKALSGHTIVCGFGRMGRLLTDRLARLQVPLVVVEKNEQRLAELRTLGCLYVVGDATEEWVLQRAGIERCKKLVAALANDADNLFVTLTARQMNADLFIVARAEESATEPKLRRAGANRVVSPQTIGADLIANTLTRPHVVEVMDVASKGVELEMAEVEIPSDSPLVGKSLREADIRKQSDIIVVAIRRADSVTMFNPGPDERMQPGDLLITIGKAGAASQLAKRRGAGESA